MMHAVSKAVLAAVMLQAAQAQEPTVTLTSPGAQFGTASSGLTLTLLVDDALAWVDLDGAKFKQVPVEVQNMSTSVPSAQVTAGSVVRFDCPSQVAGGCQGYIWYYFCPAKNCNPDYQGGLPGVLAATDGWVFTRCAPRFVTGVASGYVHEMRGYRYRLDAGTDEEVTVPSQAEFLAFGLESAPHDCTQYGTQIACESATTNERCVWDAVYDMCKETTCSRGGGQGPVAPCTECPWQDLATRPASDGP